MFPLANPSLITRHIAAINFLSFFFSSPPPLPVNFLCLLTFQTYILDEQLNEVPKGEIGHLFLGGPGVMLGYPRFPQTNVKLKSPKALTLSRYTDKAATERVLVKHDLSGSPIYKTGDLARYQEGGSISSTPPPTHPPPPRPPVF